MVEFARTLTVISLVGAVVLMISPDGSIKRYISLALALTGIAYVGKSLLLFDSFQSDIILPQISIEDNAEALNEEVLKQTKYLAEGQIKSAIMEKFQISTEDVLVSVILNEQDGSVFLSDVTVEIRGAENMVKITDIKFFLHEQFGALAQVVYKE